MTESSSPFPDATTSARVQVGPDAKWTQGPSTESSQLAVPIGGHYPLDFATLRSAGKRAITILDPYVIALLTTVALASLFPCRGLWADAFGLAANTAIVLLFFLHGAKLSREAIVAGAFAWRLHLLVFSVTFVLFPIVGLGVARVVSSLANPATAAGLLFLTLLPSTVQSSIAFTAVARGNVSAAICSASFSNLAGILVTPLLVAVLMHSAGHGAHQDGAAFSAAKSIALQLLLPFFLGHLSRPWTANFVQRHKPLTGLVDRGSILLVVYTAFSAAVVGGLWRTVSGTTMIVIISASLLILIFVLVATYALGHLLHLPREDRIVLIFCGSKKSLASGVPMAAVLFSAGSIGTIILPLMVFHQLQLIACAVIARAFNSQQSRSAAAIGGEKRFRAF